MANALMMRYAASRGANDGGQTNRMAKEDGKYQERGIGNDEHGHRLPFREPRPEFGETEARYRGEDGRYKSGRRMSEMNDREKKWEFTVTPQDGYRERMESYMPPETEPYDWGGAEGYDDPSGRVIGFGAIRNHYGEQRNMGMQRSQRGHVEMDDAAKAMDRETATAWVRGMKNEDPQYPTGGKFEVTVVKTMAKNLGIPDDGPEFWELYAMMNAMYSDYSKVMQKYGVTDPMVYAHLAKAWMHDKDAVEGKTMKYYECIVKH